MTGNPRVAAVQPALPPHRHAQSEITATLAEVVLGDRRPHELLHRLHRSSQVQARHLAVPLEEYRDLGDFGATNARFIQVATDLGVEAVTGALDRAGLRPEDVDVVVTTTVTGFAIPSLDARIAARTGLRPDVHRLPLMGLGCVGGASGLARVRDLLAGHPDRVAVLLSVELCTLTLQPDDTSTAALVANGLFGDGAAAVVVVGADRTPPAGVSWDGPELLDSRSHLYPGTERAMGWDVGATGLKVVLGVEVPDLVRTYLGDDVRGFLADHDLAVEDVVGWVSHPGGPKVIQAIEETLGLPDDALELTWASLADVGNLSSASVLHVLHDTLVKRAYPAGSPGLLMAMGPGFCSELVLLRW